MAKPRPATMRRRASIRGSSRSGTASRDVGTAVRIDVTDETSIRSAAALVGCEGPVGLIVVASGILHGPGLSPEKSIAALDAGAMSAVMAVNAIGPALVAKHFVPLIPRLGRSVFAGLSARVG